MALTARMQEIERKNSQSNNPKLDYIAILIEKIR